MPHRCARRRPRRRPRRCPRRPLRTTAAGLGTAILALAAAVAPAAVARADGQAEVPPPAPAAPAAVETPRLDELQEELRTLIGDARDRVFPALVHIHTVTVQYYDGQEVKSNSVGSGTIISPDGYVLTNQHVTDNGRRFRCTLGDKQEVPCELTGEDPLTDLAVLRIDRSALDDPAAPLPHAELGDSDRLRVGDYVLAMGSPFALSRSVTLGIVSNSERVFSGGPGGGDDEMEIEEGQTTGLFTRWIQHDALINPGNSGGPLVDLEGVVIGVNELGGVGMGFAIPSNLARRVADDLIAHGEVPRSWVGLGFRPIEKTGYDQGVLIDSVIAGSPADAAGIEAGDLLVELEGRPVEVRFPEQVPPLLKRIADLPLGSEVEVAVLRGGERHTATLATVRLEKDRGAEAAFRAWGVVAQEITDKMARERRLGSTAGALVSGVRGGGPAQLAVPPLADGDVIRRVGEREIATLEDLAAAYEAELPGRDGAPGEELLIAFDRQGKNLVTVLEPRPDTDAERPLELPKAWIGIATQPVVPSLAALLGAPDSTGYRITRVYPGTEAAAAGLEVGDVVTALDGEPLEPRGVEDAGLLARRVRRMSIGGEAVLTVARGGEAREVAVTLERTRPGPEEARRLRDPDFELTVREVTFFDRDAQRWDDDVRGVLVEQVEPAGWAGLAGVRPGDLVQRFGGRAVGGLDDLSAALETAVEARDERVEMVVLRGARTHFLYLEPEWSPLAEDGGDGGGDGEGGTADGNREEDGDA